MDRAYVDFQRLFFLTLSSAFFVVRTKTNVLLQRRYSHKIDQSTGVRSDHTVILTSFESASAYPDALRRVTYLDVEKKKRFKFLTNNFTLPAHVIAKIYKSRWANAEGLQYRSELWSVFSTDAIAKIYAGYASRVSIKGLSHVREHAPLAFV
jgi:hypothetical protein